MKKKNGFTLVELLAVIVVLAIIMVIAIPNVLDSMNKARKRSFVLEAQKFVKDVKTTYTTDAGLGGAISGPGIYVYELSRDDVGYDETGSYHGYVVIDAYGDNINDPQYYLFMYDDNYEVLNHSYSQYGLEDSVVSSVKKDTKSLTPYDACNRITVDYLGDNETRECYNRKGWLITADTSSNNSGNNSSHDDLLDDINN